MRALLITLLLPAACSSISTSYDFDPEADFDRLGSYAWLRTDKESDPLVIGRVRKAADAELAKKGYTLTTRAPTFRIAAHLRSRTRVRVRETTTVGPYVGWGYHHWHDRRLDYYEYEEGSLILDVIDAQTRKLIWRGVARAAVSDSPKPEEITKTVNEAVEKLLLDFPPP